MNLYDLTSPPVSGVENTIIEDYGVGLDEGILAGLSGRTVSSTRTGE